MASSRKAAPDLAGTVASRLSAHLAPRRRIAVGYSGGLDSSVLLHILAGLRASGGFSLSAVHVHHGLSPRADAWAAHCARCCAQWAVPLEVVRVRVAPAGEGLEAAARRARYQAYARLGVDAVVLAQHRDDQAETVLLQLLRGATPKGLAAMPEARRMADGRTWLLRPLLDAPRADLAAYAAAAGLAWVEDESNADPRFARNALRHQVLPVLERYFPGGGQALAAAAGQFAEQAQLLDALAELDGREVIEGDALVLDRLAGLPAARGRNLLRHFLELRGGVVRRHALHEAWRQLLDAGDDALVRLEFGPVSLRRFRGRAILVPEDAGGDAAPLAWAGEAVVDMGRGGRLEFQPTIGQGVRLAGGPVTIRHRRGGERMHPGAGRPGRTLKNLLREAGVPPWQRAALPLVYVGDALAWAALIGADARWAAGAGEPGWLIAWRPPA